MTACEKPALRRELGAALRSMTPEERAVGAEAIGATLDRLLASIGATAGPEATPTLVMGYLALPREVDLDAAMDRWLAAGGALAVPRVDRDRIIPVRISSLESSRFAIDRFGVRAPVDWEVADPAAIDVVLVPGLAFDRDGSRLGRGGGHYDRFLTELPPTTLRVGVCFARQVIASVPQEPHDARVDVVVSDAGVSYTPRIPQALRSFGQGLVDDAASGR